MTQDEKELLSLLFIKQGEQQLQEGNNAVFETCELATQIAPESPLIHFRKGMVYALQRENMRCLQAAAESLQKAVELDPQYMTAWFEWANVLHDIGYLSEDMEVLARANERFAKAEDLAKEALPEDHADLYWAWGQCLCTQGVFSGEPPDLLAALEKFKKAQELGLATGQFYHDLASLYSALAQLLPLANYQEMALENLRKTVELQPDFAEAWLGLGCALTLKFQETGDEQDFLEAHEAFEKCTDLNDQDVLAWVRWGHLLVFAGKLSADIDKVYASFEKFESAKALDPDMPRLLLHWGEALMIAGVHEERLDWLKEAETKITNAIRGLSTVEEAWAIYGACLGELGHYFTDENYYKQAIEKFKYGLTLFPSSHLLAMGLAHAQMALGDLKSSVELLEEALQTYDKYNRELLPLNPPDLNEWGVTWMKLAEITQKREHAAAAVEKFEQAITMTLQKTGNDKVDSTWMYNYGSALDFLGDFYSDVNYYEKAVQALSHVVSVDPTHPYAKYNLALALYHRAELTQDFETFKMAIDIIQELTQADPEDDVLWCQYGLMMLNLAVLSRDPATPELTQTLFTESEQRLQKALACGSLDAFYHLACLHALLGNSEGAIHYLQCSEKQRVLPPVEEILDEEWLESLYDHPEFRSLIGRQYSDDTNP